jgi:hypothetical protein
MAMRVLEQLGIVCTRLARMRRKGPASSDRSAHRWSLSVFLLSAVLLPVPGLHAQERPLNWDVQVRKYARVHDWEAATLLVDQQIARAPQDLDVRSWRPRLLLWSGHLAQAEREYLEILNISHADPDIWLELANLYLTQQRIPDALRAINTAVELAPKRADVHASRARIFRTNGQANEARAEFEIALLLDPASTEARAGILSLQRPPLNEIRIGQDNDLFNFAAANRSEWISLSSQWTPRWSTSIAGNFYQRAGVDGAGKFLGSVTRRQPHWGGLTVGGAIGHDNGVIPKREAFFDLDHGWKTGETTVVRSLELVYGQHWFWYQTARILTLSGTAIVYLPREWNISVRASGARSAFSSAGVEWRPSGMTRLAFPLAHWAGSGMSGNVMFAVGTENFAQVDQIAAFASTALRRRTQISDQRPSRRHGLRRLRETHTKSHRHQLWNELCNPLLKNSGG